MIRFCRLSLVYELEKPCPGAEHRATQPSSSSQQGANMLSAKSSDKFARKCTKTRMRLLVSTTLLLAHSAVHLPRYTTMANSMHTLASGLISAKVARARGSPDLVRFPTRALSSPFAASLLIYALLTLSSSLYTRALSPSFIRWQLALHSTLAGLLYCRSAAFKDFQDRLGRDIGA